MIGTARYASINAHLGYEQSRRDDLEALGYVLLYFAKGKLPWQNIYADNKEEKYQKIQQMKQQNTLEQLCESLPYEFIQYFKHVKELEFEETPNYAMLKLLFQKISIDKKLQNQINVLDWESLPDYRQRKKYSTVPAIGTQSKSQISIEINNIILQQNQEKKEENKLNVVQKQLLQPQISNFRIENEDKLQSYFNNNSSNKYSQNNVIYPINSNGIIEKSNYKIETLQLLKLENSQQNIPKENERNDINIKQINDEQIDVSINILGIPSRLEQMSNLLNIPQEKCTINSGNSGGTSKINNYPFSESEDIRDEESIQVSILNSKQIKNPHSMLQDIRERTSQLNIFEKGYQNNIDPPQKYQFLMNFSQNQKEIQKI